MVSVSECPWNAWAFLSLEHRRRLRLVFAGRGGVFGDPREPVHRGRLAHLADRPRCSCVREEAA